MLTKELGIYEGFFCEIDFEKIIPKHIIAKEFSKYPYAQKDITILVDKNISFDQIALEIKKAGIENLKNIYPLDIYQESPSDEQIALSLRMTIQSMHSTLTENDFTGITTKVLEITKTHFNAKLKE